MNKEAGEKCLELGEKKLIMRPSFKAMTWIESATNKTILEIMSCFGSHKFFFGDVAAVVYYCHLAYCKEEEEKPLGEYNEVGEMIYHSGLTEAGRVSLELLMGALVGDKKKEPTQDGPEKPEK